jgi:arylsulfatase A
MKTFACTLLASLFVAPLTFACAADPPARPNVVVILIDDLPYAGLSVTGNPYLETPHLDRVAKQGMFFTRAYSEVVCGPSRTSLITGQNAARHGRTDNVPGVHPFALMQEPLVPAKPGAKLEPGAEPKAGYDLGQGGRLPEPVTPEAFTLVKALKAAGYTTGLSGKWHMTLQHLTPNAARAFGFDFCSPPAARSKPYRDTGRVTNDAIRFIRDCTARDPAREFFLYLPFVAVHGGHVVPPDDQERWRQRLAGTTPGIPTDLLATLEFVDRSVGRVLDTLDELGIADDTLVVLAGDNGGVCKKVHGEENKPFRMGKGSLYEGGIRVPLFMRWPVRIAPGTRCDVPVHLSDLMPTLCEAAGAAIAPGHVVDGASLLPLLSGGSIPERTLFVHYPHYLVEGATTPTRVAIQGRYKLLWSPYDHIAIEGRRAMPNTLRYVPEPRVELFDLEADPGERHDLSAAQPKKVAELRGLFEAFMKRSRARDVAPNPDYDATKPLYNARHAALAKSPGE